MAAVLEQVSEDLAQAPTDPERVRRFAAACLEQGDLERLRGGFDPTLGQLSGPVAVRPVAESLARALADRAARIGATAMRPGRHGDERAHAVDLYLRAARLLALGANDRVGAAELLAAAWRVLPDQRIAQQAQALFVGTGEAPHYTLVALAEVGDRGQQIQALRRLAATELERRRLEQAESLFARLERLHPGDPDVAAGLEVIAALRASGQGEVELLERELAALPQGERSSRTERAERATLLRRTGDAHRKSGRQVAAEQAYAAASELGDEPSLRALEALLREDGRFEELAEHYRGLLKRAPRERQLALRKKLYLVLQGELQLPEAAREVLEAAPHEPEGLTPEPWGEAAERLDASDLPVAERVARLEELAATTEPAADRLALLERAARLAESAAEPPHVVERLWRKVKAIDPQSRGALTFYRAYFAAHPDPRRAYANLAQLHAITADPAERRALATEMATLAEAQRAATAGEAAHGTLGAAGSLDRAIEAWRLVERDLGATRGARSGDVDPRDPALLHAWGELRRLYAAGGRWHAYVDLLDRWAQAEPDPARQTELLFDIVEVYQDPQKLPMPAMVLQTYQRIMELAPHDPVALDQLAVGLAEREQWTDLLAVLSRKLELATDPGELIHTFQQIADLYLDHIRSESQAIVVLERLLELNPDDLEVVKRLRELYQRRHDSEQHFRVLERELDLTDDVGERVRIFGDLARIAQDELLQPELAVAFHRQILELDPTHAPSLEALQTLHAEQEDWLGYVAILEQRVAEAKTKTAKLPLLLELGEAVLTRLGDVERAEQIFSTIAESSPTSATARRFLQRIFVARQKWDELARLFARSAAKAAPAAPVTPAQRWKDYVALLRDSVKHETDPPLVSAIHVELARVLETELDDKKGAADHLEAALRAVDDQVEIARRQRALLGEEAPGPRKLVALTTIARHSPDTEERNQAWLAIGAIHRRAKDFVQACDAWGRALVCGAEAGAWDALGLLEEDAGATGRWEQAKNAMDEALFRLPPDAAEARVALHRALGTIARARLLDADEAIRHFKWVLQLSPGDAVALEELEKIHFSRNDFAGLEDIYRARVEAAPTQADTLDALRRLARLFDDVMLDPERAAAAHQDILRLAPDDADALDALIRALEQTGAYADLATALEAALTHTRDPARRDALDLRLALLWADQLGDPLAAIDHCRDLVERAPSPARSAEPSRGLAEVVALLERYAAEPILRRDAAPVLEAAYRKLGRLPELARMLELRVDHASPAELQPLLDELAMLAEGVLAAPDKAFSALLRRFALTPQDPGVWAELERLAAATRGWEELARAWRERLDATPPLPPEASAPLRLRLAEVYHRRLIELEDAIDQTERARAETADPALQLEALEALEVLYKKAAELDRFVEVKLESAGRVLSRSLRRSKTLEAAAALAGALTRPEDAIAALEPLWLEDPADNEVADLIIGLVTRLGDHARTDATYSDAIGAAPDEARRDDLRLRRALLRRDQLGQWEAAISDLIDLADSPTAGREARRSLLEISRAQESDAQRDVILEVLLTQFRKEGDQEGLINTLVVQAEFTPPGPERAAILRAAAWSCLPELQAHTDPSEGSGLLDDGLLRERIRDEQEDAQHAFSLLTQALSEAPDDRVALDGLRRIAGAMEIWGELAEVLLSLAELPIPVPDARRLLREEANIREHELEEPERAVATLVRELELADEHGASDIEDTLVSLDRLYRQADDVEARRVVLLRMADSRPEPIARAEVLETLALLELESGQPESAAEVLERALEELGAADRAAARSLRQRLLGTLEGILVRSQRFAELVDLLVQSAALEDDWSERRELLHRAAESSVEALRDLDRGIVLYEQLIETDPGDELALSQLVDLYSEVGHWPSAVAILRRQRAIAEAAHAEAEVCELDHQIGLIQLDHLGDTLAALQSFAAVLASAPTHPGALDALHRVEQTQPARAPAARRIMAEAHRQQGDAARLAEVLERVATFDAPPPSLLRELADLWLGPLDHAPRALPHLARAYALDPLGADGAAARLRLVEMTAATPEGPARAESGRKLVAILDDVARGIPDAAARRARKDADLAALDALGLDEVELAPALRALAFEEPRPVEIITRLEALARSTQDLPLLAEALEARAASLDPVQRTAVEIELGAVLERLPQRRLEAVRVYRAVLARDAGNEPAFDALDHLLGALGRHAERAALLAEGLARPSSPARRSNLRRALAAVSWRELGQPERAVELLGDELDLSPASTTEVLEQLEAMWSEGSARQAVFRLLEPAYQTLGDWDKLVALYTSTLEQDDPALQLECLTKLAELERVRLDRPEAAFTTLVALLERLDESEELGPRVIQILDDLEALARQLGRWDELIDRLEAMAGLGQGGAPLLARLARIHEHERRDAEHAAHFYRFAFQRDPNDTASRDALSALLTRAGRWSELATHLLDAASQNHGIPRFALELEAARVLDEKAASPHDALRILEALVLEAPPDSAVAQEGQQLIERILERLGDHAALHRHYRRWLELAPSDAVAIDVQVRLGRSLIRFPATAREGLTELEEVHRAVPDQREVIPALWSMITACERLELSRDAAGQPHPVDPGYAEATADAARLLEEILGPNAPADTLAGIEQAKLRVQPAGVERQASLLRLARLMAQAEEAERAFAYYADALRGDPGNPEIEAELVELVDARRYWESLATLYEELSVTDDASLGPHYVLEVAKLLHERLERPDEATAWFERHLDAMPGSRDAVVPLAAYYRDFGDAASEARVLVSWIDYAARPDEIVDLRMRLGILRMDQLGDVQGAIDSLEGCLPEGAGNPEIVRRLERLYVRGEHFPALVDLYRAALGRAANDRERLEILAKMAQVHETRLADLESARETARAMLELEPQHRFALTALERIERARGDWDAVDEVLGKKLAATPAEGARIKILLDRAEVALTHRKQPDEALDHLLAADKLVGPGPGPDELVKGLEALLRATPNVRVPAARALGKRYRARQSWQGLINVIMLELVAAEDGAERFALATQAAEVATERLNDRGVALRVLVSALRQGPEQADLRALVERTARESGGMSLLLKTGDEMMKRGVPDEAVVGFARWLGGLQAMHGEPERAIRSFEKVLEVEPGDAAAGDALAALYRDKADWPALRGLYHQRVTVAPASERATLELDLALHLADHEGLEATTAAVRALLEAHAADPRLRTTLLARVAEPVAGAAATAVLAAQLRAEGRTAELVKLLEQRADKAPATTERVALLAEAATLCEAEINDRVAAVRLLAKAAELAPDARPTWERLRELATRVGAWDDLARALSVGAERAAPPLSSELALALAELQADRPGVEAPEEARAGLDRAAATLRAAITRAPDALALREALVRYEVRRGDLGALEVEIVNLVDYLDDPEAERGLWITLRDLATDKGDEARVVTANEALLARDHSDAEAAGALAAHYRRHAQWDDLAELLYLRASASDDARAAAAFWRELAELRQGPLADPAGAADAWREAWALDPAHPEVARRLVQVASDEGDFAEAAELWATHAEALEDLAARATAWIEAGRLQDEKLKSPDDAIAAYQAALEADPKALPALNALIGLHGRTRRYAELAEVLEAKAAAVTAKADRCLTLVQAAAVHLDQLRNAARARPLLDEVLAVDVDHLEARLLMARLHVREGRADLAVATLEELAKRTEGKRRVRLLMDLARLQVNDVGAPDKAANAVEEALALDPTTPGLEALAVDVLTRAQRWERLQDLYAASYDAARTDKERAERALKLARLYAGPLPSPERLAHWVELARTADPESIEPRLLEVDALVAAESWAEAESLLTEVVELLERRRAADELVRRCHQLGALRIRLDRPDRVDDALKAFARAHELDGKHVPNLIDYGRALVAAQRWQEALAIHQALLLQRQAIPDEQERYAVLERLALASWEANQKERARAYLSRLLTERPQHAGGLALRARFNGG